jgi:hypothetical protein
MLSRGIDVTFIMRPDFIVVGARTLVDGQEGVHLTASNQVVSTDVDVDFGIASFDLESMLREPSTMSAKLIAQLRSFSMVYAPTYAEAWERLMRMGNPDDPQRQAWTSEAIESPRRQLPPG